MAKATGYISIVILILLVPTISHAAGFNIPGSKHDLTLASGFSTDASSCYICHSPHTVTGSTSPLWSQGVDDERFRAYNSSETGYEALKQDGGVLVCLGCHDGTFADLSIYIESSMNSEEQEQPGNLGEPKGPGPDHPVNMVYFTYYDDPEIRPAVSDSEVTDGEISLKLYDGRVQCGSCHDVHNGHGEAFLRESNEGSQLCTVCHLK